VRLFSRSPLASVGSAPPYHGASHARQRRAAKRVYSPYRMVTLPTLARGERLNEGLMILAYHVVFGAYGFWLPNDPRGSWSDFVGSWELFRFGPATTTETRNSVAGVPHDRAAREAAKDALLRPPVHFSGEQARAVATGFGESARRGNVMVWACSVLPEHVHLVIARHTQKVEQIVNLFKGAATRRLIAEQLHPFQALADEQGKVPTCWARKCWKVFLDDVAAIERAIRYVEENPVKEGKRRQRWKFVTPFDPTLV
jgi:REP element-mobilizing transposase RayT